MRVPGDAKDLLFVTAGTKYPVSAPAPGNTIWWFATDPGLDAYY